MNVDWLFYLPNYNCRFIRCWDAELARERYRITAGLGGSGSGKELCIWALLALRYVVQFYIHFLLGCFVGSTLFFSIDSFLLFQVWDSCYC